MRAFVMSVALAMQTLPSLAQERVVTICADPDPPPWTYWVRDAEGRPTETVAGFSIDLMNAVFKQLNVRVTWIGSYPWARCMKEVQNGKVDFALGAYFNDKRALTFAYTRPYSRLTPQVFFRRQKVLDIQSKSDLRRYQGCGLIGASYAHYGLGPKDVDSGVNTYAKLLTKLKLGRCDYFVEELEIMAGHKILGRDVLSDPDIAHAAVPDARAPAHHLIAAKGTPAAALIPDIDRSIGLAIRSGRAAQLWQRHAKELPYRP